MALTITVTKKSVALLIPKQWTVTFNMTCIDAAIEVLNQDFNQDYKEGDDIANLAGLFKAAMQAAIDKYKAEQVIFTHTKMGQLEDYLDANLVG